MLTTPQGLVLASYRTARAREHDYFKKQVRSQRLAAVMVAVLLAALSSIILQQQTMWLADAQSEDAGLLRGKPGSRGLSTPLASAP